MATYFNAVGEIDELRRVGMEMESLRVWILSLEEQYANYRTEKNLEGYWQWRKRRKSYWRKICRNTRHFAFKKASAETKKPLWIICPIA